MSKSIVFFSLILTVITNAETSVTREELNEINSRIEAFYQNPGDASLMSVRIPKYSVHTGDQVQPNQILKLKNENQASALEKLAGVKSTDAFRKHYCETFLKKHFPSLRCGEEQHTWSVVEGNDRVENLTDSWMDRVSYSLDEIPAVGKSDRPNWSDDYWRTRWGITSYRYADHALHPEYPTYKSAVNAYAQPNDWNLILPLKPEEIAQKIVRYSPSEKYDILVGDQAFSLTKEQKEEGLSNLGPDGNVEEWMGICHGWAPAAIMIDRPIKSAKFIGAQGKEVEFYPGDVKALVSLAWANGSYENNFIGGRCNDKTPKLLKNGRIADQNCFDNNPATFHLSLGNLIGRAKAGFVMDKTFDYEVWNQPVVGYEFTYFNPNNPSIRDKDWKKVVVAYDATFKQKDRFQNPLTRGSKRRRGDKNIRQIVGVIATVVYGSELSPPKHQPTPEPDFLERVTYTYDLELEEQNGQVVPTGGEWHENAHPDFLWTPRKDTLISSTHDRVNVGFTGTTAPTPTLTNVARGASRDAYPLCQVVREVVKGTTGTDTYQCIVPRR